MNDPEIVRTIYERAKAAHATIALPDTVLDSGLPDTRIADAVKIMQEKGVATPLLITPEYFAHLPTDQRGALIKATVEARATRNKPITEDEARSWLSSDPKYVAAALVRTGMVDGYVAGNVSTTEDTLRPALQVIGTNEYASSYFVMIFPDGRTTFFADCGFNHEPSSEELAKIAIDTAQSAQQLGIEPRIAFISSSTAGSGSHPRVEKVQKAIALARERAPELKISEHEMQVDAALTPSVAEKKLPGSEIGGNATILVFPDLDSGNSVYKMANLMGARAIGPIMQGMKGAANDLSRGCSTQDIVDVVAVTAMQAGALKNKNR